MFGAKPFPTMKILMLFKKKLAKKRTDDDRNSFHFILWVNLSLIDRLPKHSRRTFILYIYSFRFCFLILFCVCGKVLLPL